MNQQKNMNVNPVIATDGKRVLLVNRNGSFGLPESRELTFKSDDILFRFGSIRVVRLSVVEADTSMIFPMREALSLLDEEGYRLLAKGIELLNWDKDTRFCSKDGSPLVRNSEISKICGCCGTEYFPSLSPAMVVLVTRGDEALLVKAKSFKNPIFALVAGYVETGETLEECVKREVREETSIEIDDVKYIGSQSWPFPGQLMLGFTARYVKGEINFADGELAEGGFFTRDNVPPLPSPPSLSRHIIDLWLRNAL